MWRRVALTLALSVAACATPIAGMSTPSGPAQIPSAPLELGNWRASSEGATQSAFQRSINSRYAAGAAITAVAADLRRNRFSCAPPAPDLADNRAVPPVQVCRRTQTVQSCTHTWQVHLFDNMSDRRLARTRSLYDRRCGDNGLLGGP